MPICPTCGEKFSGFSFGRDPAAECRKCRKARAQAQAAPLTGTGVPVPMPDATAIQRAPLPVVTLIIIGLNALVYLGMGLSGASWTEPTVQQAIRWGADYAPLTLSNQPWRLLTSTFVHFGFAHILFNMWCLFSLGRSLEFLMGRKVFAATYLASGLAASLVSLAWSPWRVSAGASGAIFGVAGAFAAYMYVRKIPTIPGTIRQTRGSLALFILYNLARGATAVGIDNSAHLGGLLAGLALGVMVPPAIKIRKEEFGAVPRVIMAEPRVEVRSEEEANAARLAWRIVLGSIFVLLIGLAGVHARYADVADYGRAIQLLQSGNADQAVPRLQRIIDRNSKFVFPRVVLGQLFLDQRNPTAAIAPLESALAIDSNEVEIEHNLALAYLGAGRPADAEREIEKVFDAEKNSRWAVLFIRGAAEAESLDFDAAVADMRTVVQAYPDWPDGKVALGQLDSLQRDASHKSESVAQTAQSPQVTIPYSDLVMKSEEWPLFP